MLAVTYAMAAIAGLRPPTDPDIWWHLRTAGWIIDHGAVPFVDPFSAYGMGKPWIAYSWLFELILLALYRALGLAGVVLFAALGSLLTTIALHRLVARYERRVPYALAVTLVAVAAMAPVFWPRSYVLSIILFVIELHVILYVRETGRARALLLLPLITAVWANLHIQFVYGLFVLGAAALAVPLERWLPAAVAGARSLVGFKPFALALLASMAATLVTPYHVWIYRALFDHVTHTGTFDLINELHAPMFRGLADWSVLGMALAAVFVLGRQRLAPPFFVLLMAAGLFVSFRAARDVWFVVIVAAVIVARAQQAVTTPRHRPSPRLLAGVCALTVAIVALFAASRDVSPRALDASVAQTYPVAASRFVAERRYPGPLFNHYDWGGYLIWRLPALPVSMDGRANVYGPERIRRSVETWAGLRGWDADPDLLAARLVIAQRRFALAELLRRHPRFEVVYEDDVAVVFVAREAPAEQRGHDVPRRVAQREF
jgi:hypothetical protein